MLTLEDGVRERRRHGNVGSSAGVEHAAGGDDSARQLPRESRSLPHAERDVAGPDAGRLSLAGARHVDVESVGVAAGAQHAGGPLRVRMRGRKRLRHLDQLVVAGAHW